MEFGRVWAEINLDALNNNLNEVRREADSGKILLAIKADAYGHGLREVAQEVSDRVDVFGVASTDEGITLRLGGIKNAILVLSPIPYREIPALFEHNLTPSVTETEFAHRLSKEAVKRNTTIGLHVEVDTGMGRTGVDDEVAAEFVATVADLPGLDVEGVFTHFPAADSDTNFTRHQLQLYERVMSQLSHLGISGYLRHTANTAGLLNVSGSRYDLIRPGLVVYGILPDSYQSGHRATDLKLTPVMSLRSRIVNLRDIASGRSISYERTYFTKRDSRIAVITAGYGDGYPWSLKNRGKAMVRGSRVPIVGNVCMDLTMLDVTDVPNVQIGDTVTLLGSADGDTITANELAGWAETIPYEIICRVSPRVPRVYLRAGEVEKTRTLLDHYNNG
ncbi:MAG TPA: alanine racemase [bacterium]|nr:alanine racemase [bacterium]